jgi:IclR family acetate operon transcriptional repressor
LAVSGVASVGELSLATGLPKPTVSRLMASMLDNEAVQRVGPEGTYSIGDGLRHLTGSQPSVDSLEAIAYPRLRELQQVLGEDVGLATRHGDVVVYGRTFATEATVTVQPWEGESAPLHAVAAGYVYLAAMSDQDVTAYCLRGLPELGPNTLVTVKAVRERVGRVRQDGYCWTHEEWAKGIDGAAAPITSSDGAVIAAINVYGPSYRFGDSTSTSEIGRSLAEAGRTLSAMIRARSG